MKTLLNFEVKGQGPTLLLLHGYLENTSMWEAYSNDLARNFQVVIPDLPGHGQSEVYAETHRMELMAEKVNEVLDELGITEVLIVGHSMGGYVTLAFAELYPQKTKAFILMNSTSFPDSDEKKELRLRAIDTAQRNMNALIKMSIPLLFDAERLNELTQEKEFAKEMARSTPLTGVLAALKGMRERKDRSFVLRNFKGKIGVILGSKDRTVDPIPIKQLAESLRNVKILEQETGHMAYLEAKENTLQFIQDFAEEVFWP